MTGRQLLLFAKFATCATCATCATVLAGCAPGETSQLSAPIIGGSSDQGHDEGVPMVFTLNSPNGSVNGFCTAELITPRVVMTAAHCTPGDPEEGVGGDAVVFCDGITNNIVPINLKLRRPVIKYWVHPLFNPENFDSGYDVALLLMDGPAPSDIAPLKVNRTRLQQSMVGMPLRLVGFGDTDPNQTSNARDREVTTTPLAGLNDLFISFGTATHNICSGDSGGPAFLTINGVEVIAGVTSGSSGCTGASFDTRVDTFLNEIDAFIAENDPQPPVNCGADGICGQYCTAPDPDCPCMGDGFCTATCDHVELDPDCPDGCAADGRCVRDGCPVPDPDCGAKDTGEECTAAGDCASNFCALGGATGVCAPKCDSSGSCPSGFSCNTGSHNCLPSSGGCQVGAGASSPVAILLGILALALARRRRLSPIRV